MKIKKILALFIFLLLLILLASTTLNGCSKNKEKEDLEEPLIGEVYEGLHITGTPIDINIETYSLNITGLVEREISLTFDQIKKMESVRMEIELICPGSFIDKGYWSGVRVMDVLNLAGIKNEAKFAEFRDFKAGYRQSLPLEKLNGEGFLIAYEFDDKEFSKYHGYPLRLVAKGEPGFFWVKWLGEVKLLAELQFRESNDF
jgi:DMSO/TMAO reductase YedYZ molybdopterin-dependent catalytic subunit